MGKIVAFGENTAKRNVDFDEKFAESGLFAALFKEGMGLVKETAAYLDGPGRADSAAMDRNGALLYAKESMSLTTRLMQMASWLLLHRAIGEGEISSEESRSKKNIVPVSAPEMELSAETRALPGALVDLITRTSALQQRIVRLDAALHEKSASPAGINMPDTLETHMARIQSAFEDAPGKAD